MPTLKNYHILISHSWNYSDQYETLKSWLDSSPYFNWTDYSVPITKPLYYGQEQQLKDLMQKRIALCSCIIVVSGMYVTHSKWIDFEIDTAAVKGKPIIGIKPWGQERVPLKIQTNADVLVGWNSTSVIEAVRNYAL